MEVNSVLVNSDFISSDYTSNIMNHLSPLSNIKQQNDDATKYRYDRMYNFRGDGAIMVPNYGQVIYEENGTNPGYKPSCENMNLCQENMQHSIQHQVNVNSNMNCACFLNPMLDPRMVVNDTDGVPQVDIDTYSDSNTSNFGGSMQQNPGDRYSLSTDNDIIQKGNITQKNQVLNSNYLIYSIASEADLNDSTCRTNSGLDLGDNCNANVPEMGGDVADSGGGILSTRNNFTGTDNNGNSIGNSSNNILGGDMKAINGMVLKSKNLNTPDAEGYNSMIKGGFVNPMIEGNMAMAKSDMHNGHLIHLNGNVYHEINQQHQDSEMKSNSDSVMVGYDDMLYMDHEEKNNCHIHSENKSLSIPPCIHTRIRPEFHEIGDKAIELIVGPAKHQVKEFNILPLNVLRISYNAKNSDYIIVKLICDKQIRRHDPTCIFLAGVSAKYSVSETGESILPNMKISKDMLQGRTKGFKFYLSYTLIMDGREAMTIRSEPFQIWSNVNQLGFPRKQRERHIQERKDTNRKKRKMSS